MVLSLWAWSLSELMYDAKIKIEEQPSQSRNWKMIIFIFLLLLKIVSVSVFFCYHWKEDPKYLRDWHMHFIGANSALRFEVESPNPPHKMASQFTAHDWQEIAQSFSKVHGFADLRFKQLKSLDDIPVSKFSDGSVFIPTVHLEAACQLGLFNAKELKDFLSAKGVKSIDPKFHCACLARMLPDNYFSKIQAVPRLNPYYSDKEVISYHRRFVEDPEYMLAAAFEADRPEVFRSFFNEIDKKKFGAPRVWITVLRQILLSYKKPTASRLAMVKTLLRFITKKPSYIERILTDKNRAKISPIRFVVDAARNDEIVDIHSYRRRFCPKLFGLAPPPCANEEVINIFLEAFASK